MLADLDFQGYDYVSDQSWKRRGIPRTNGLLKSLTVLMFFVTYVAFQFPSTVLIRKIGPPYFLSTIVLCWGILMIVSFYQHPSMLVDWH